MNAPESSADAGGLALARLSRPEPSGAGTLDPALARDQAIALAAQSRRRAEEAEAALSAALARATQAEAEARWAQLRHAALAGSLAWRATGPLRAAFERMPPARRALLLRAARLVWRIATPWRIPARLRLLRAKRRFPLAGAQPATPGGADAAAADYQRWIADHERRSSPPDHPSAATPWLTLMVFAAPGRPEALAATLASIAAQTAPVAVVVAAPRAAPPPTRDRLPDLAVVRTDAADAQAACADLLAAARTPFVAMMGCGDRLAPDALGWIAAAIAATPGVELLYSDEDRLDARGLRGDPRFKPAPSPELLHAYNYFGRISVIRRDVALALGGYPDEPGVAAEWALHLAIVEAGCRVARLPRVLCHRDPRADADRAPPDSPEAEANRRALARFWAARNVDATVATRPDGTQHATYPIDDPPLVSVVIPTRDKADLLRACLDGLLRNTDYPRIEIVLVDNGSTEPATQALYDSLRGRADVSIVAYDAPFNYSRACNLGAARARGGLLLFLNNDIEITEPGWLSEMARIALRPGVGVVGARLHFPDGRLQHGGVVVGMHICGLAFRDADPDAWGLSGSAGTPRNWLAIMGACQMVTRAAFTRVGGFDETYRIAMSDVALCLRAHRAGYRTAYTPYARLTHHEGASRGHSNPELDERRVIADALRAGLRDDPYFHPSLAANVAIPTFRTSALPAIPEIFAGWARDAAGGDPSGGPGPLWPPVRADQIVDVVSAARWLLDLLRDRSDIRLRFPRALALRDGGACLRWLRGEADAFGLSAAALDWIGAALARDHGHRVRDTLAWNKKLRAEHPLGLVGPARAALAAAMLRDHAADAVTWALMEAAEDPGAELLRLHGQTPDWQNACPDAPTVFGRVRFAAWIADTYGLDAPWLDPSGWPETLTPARQIRLGWKAAADWRAAHPAPFRDEQSALALLGWLCDAAPIEPAARAWCRALDRDATAADLARGGLNIIGHFCYPSGLRTSALTLASAARAEGLDVVTRNLRAERTDEPRHDRYAGLEIYDVTLLHVQPEPFFPKAYRRADLAPLAPRGHRIAYWYWELEDVPDEWAAVADEADEVWAATRFVADALRRTIRRPVLTMFPGVQTPRFTPEPRRAFGLDERAWTFLFSFHITSVMERKNPLGLIKAFRAAFGPEDDAALVLKLSYGHRRSDDVAALRQAAARANIHVIDEVYSDERMLALIDACDCYVSLHRSEGLGLTPAEAMLLGKPVIATRYSGNLDFMDDDNSLLVDCDLVPVGEAVPPYDAGARWAEPSIAHAAALMRRVYDNQDWARALGRRARADATNRLSVAAAGARIAARLAEINAGRYAASPVRATSASSAVSAGSVP